MRRHRLQPLIALLCALFLLGAQQAAYAHFLGHIGFAEEVVAQDGGDSEHGAASTLSHVCTTCAAFAALDAAPPVAPVPVPAATAVVALPISATPAELPIRAAAAYSPRAPPAVF